MEPNRRADLPADLERWLDGLSDADLELLASAVRRRALDRLVAELGREADLGDLLDELGDRTGINLALDAIGFGGEN